MQLFSITTTSLALLMIGGSMAAHAQSTDVQEKSYNLELADPNAPAHLEVDMHNGSVKVEGYDGKTIEVLARLSPLTDKQLTELRQQDRHRRSGKKKPVTRSTEGLKPVSNRSLNLELEVRDNRVEVSSEYTSYNVDLTIQVPRGTSVDAEVYKGTGITISGVDGALELESYNGDIQALDVTGPLVAETHKNDIVVTFAGLSTKAPTSLTTHTGDIDVTLGSGIATTVNVKSYKGEILSGLDAEFVAVDDEKRSQKGDRHRITVGGQLAAQVNGGGQSITLNTYDGNIYLRKQ